MKNYYQLLGIPNFASAEEAKRAYRQLMLKHHPDANPNSVPHNEITQLLNEIKSVLSNPETKAEYDAHLRRFLSPGTHTQQSRGEWQYTSSQTDNAHYWDIDPLDDHRHLLADDEIERALKFNRQMGRIVTLVLFFILTLFILGVIYTVFIETNS